MPIQDANTSGSSRRDFLKAGTVAGISGTLLSGFAGNAKAYAGGDDVIRVGLVGCGGRGTGAANQALNADPHAKLVAVGDAFPEQVDFSLNVLKKQEAIADRVVVDDDHKFVGLDSFKHVIDNCDVVLLASPPGFRPQHLAYAVEKEKHIFTEKPIATDAPGVRSVMESVRKAKEKGLSLQTGFCWRFHNMVVAFFEQLHQGGVGNIEALYGSYLAGPVKPMPPASERPQGMSDLEWMVRNWYNFNWLCGDGLVEQAVHVVDWIAWAKNDTQPKSCVALGGRQIPSHGGNIFDHLTVNYLWEDGTRAFMHQRQQSGCANEYCLEAYGTKGVGRLDTREAVINAGEDRWRFKGETPNMYQVEHDVLFKAIRDNEPINYGDHLVNSTMLAIMGRMAGYTGKEITWDMAFNSQESLVPEITDWNTPVEELFRSPTPLPGVTPFA